MTRWVYRAYLAAALSAVCHATPVSAAACESLSRLVLPHTAVTLAERVAPGAFVPPSAQRPGGAQVPAGAARAYAALPELCRVAATITPTSDSDIKIEVWMPASGWSGKFQAVGNGGWAGTIPYAAMAAAAGAGYATAATDTGHTGNNATFALGRPEKVIDMGYRAVHEMTVQAKAIVDGFYGAPPKLSIWNGCSQGGRQGVTEAVRYPADFDAIIAGAPGVNWMHLHAGRLAVNRSVNRTPAAAIPADKYALIHNAVIAACDARDGVRDGVVENPAACRFDPGVLQCGGSQDASACLTSAQVESARGMYASVINPRTGGEILPGLAPGSELGWAVLGATQPIGNAVEAYKYVITQNPAWDPSSFNPSADLDRALAADSLDVLGSTNPDMRAFFKRGGKLLLYHGWSDPQVTPLNTVNFFNKVVAHHGSAAVGKSVQLYMLPGVNHCAGGPGTDTFDKMGVMERWVQSGIAPDRIVASHLTAGVVDRTRPLCPFGQVAKWNGSGSTDDAANFACVVETR
ncbi:MAG TPA: tannase/feruloyl esterase family alpha/beta hydrolase [Vicinamibacterales bacterium]|nr:tannase/feruloyl esterase family alpha/beta hydrolase [Vicinamibacterales bacterium]